MLGIIVAGVKGFLIPIRERELLSPKFGLMHPRVLDAIEGLKREPKRFTHHLTNVAVEWARGEPQRATKFLAALAILGWLL